MIAADIAKFRQINQQLAETKCISAKEVVASLGAVQAQDYAMAKWAIGVRLKDSTEEEIESAYNKGEIIRTHLMRPTWHFVTAEDIYWMLDLTAARIKKSLKTRQKELELTDALLLKSNLLIAKALSDGKCLTREELAHEYREASINIANNRLSHLLLYAELEGITCSGPIKGKKLTYALLHDRVPRKNRLTREESLAKLAKRYFTSHGPATVQDFVWWSGLTVSEAKQALEFVKSDMNSEIIGFDKYWFSNSLSVNVPHKTFVQLLPAFDEFLISYKDRSASLSLTHNKKAVSNNGIFRPVIVVNGQVTGIWKRTIKKDEVIIETAFFDSAFTNKNMQFIEAVERYGRYLGKTIGL